MKSSIFGGDSNIQMAVEEDWSIVSKDADLWPGELPYKPGMQFPTEAIKERASISKTNRMIYNNDVEQVFNSIISIYPEIDPMYGWQIREIIANLGFFKNSTEAWVGLVAGEPAMVDVDSEDDVRISELVEKSNFAEVLQNEVRSRFMDVISAYRVDIGLNGKPTFVPIQTKNLIVFVNKEMTTSIEVTVVFSIYKGSDGRERVDFVEYHYNGLIRKSTFFYNNGTIAEMDGEVQEEMAFGGKYATSPIVVFKHNAVNGNVYGVDQYRFWSASMLAAMREFQNVMRLGERCREMVRKVPDTAITKNTVDGSSVFFNKGTISYKDTGDGNSPAIEYIVPEVRMTEAINALREAVNQIGIDTQLGAVFFHLGELGSRLSGDSIRAAMYPARLEAQRIGTEMLPSIKELVVKLGYMADIDLSSARINVEMFDGFPKDELADVKAVQMRLESVAPSISLEDAIMRLDHVPLRLARQRAKEIAAAKAGWSTDELKERESTLLKNSETESIIEEEVVNTGNASELRPTASEVDEEHEGFEGDDTLWETQMPFGARDIPQGELKSMNKALARRQLKKNRE